MNMISDSLWKEISKLIPSKRSKIGRPAMCPKKALNAIIYVLKTGIHWHYLPRTLGVPSTVHGKFRLWIKLGIFDQIMEVASKVYVNNQEEINIWYSTDISSCKAPLAHKWSGKNPTDRGKRGVKKVSL